LAATARVAPDAPLKARRAQPWPHAVTRHIEADIRRDIGADVRRDIDAIVSFIGEPC
jgi:hypothetical protein